MTTPDFKLQILVKCLTCSQYVKANGVTINEHVELHHMFSPGEKSAICKRCWGKVNMAEIRPSWRVGEVKLPDTAQQN